MRGTSLMLLDGREYRIGLCEGVSPKKSLIKIGEPSHTSTRFFATRLFQMPADVVGIGGGKKTPRISRWSFSRCLRTWWEWAKKHHAFPGGAFSDARADVVGIGGAKKNTTHFQVELAPRGGVECVGGVAGFPPAAILQRLRQVMGLAARSGGFVRVSHRKIAGKNRRTLSHEEICL
jgi:hypothetical protein